MKKIILFILFAHQCAFALKFIKNDTSMQELLKIEENNLNDINASSFLLQSNALRDALKADNVSEELQILFDKSKTLPYFLMRDLPLNQTGQKEVSMATLLALAKKSNTNFYHMIKNFLEKGLNGITGYKNASWFDKLKLLYVGIKDFRRVFKGSLAVIVFIILNKKYKIGSKISSFFKK